MCRASSLIFTMSIPSITGFIDSSRQVIRKPTAPLENVEIFQPYVVARDIQPAFLRESELKHGRLAMIASVLLPLSEQFSDKLGIHFFQDHTEFVAPSLALMFTSEFTSMLNGWESPFVKPFRLKEDYQPGDLGFKLPMNEETGILMDKELNNGRLAMIGVLGMMSQELVTHLPLF
jgi:hypothetical protein